MTGIATNYIHESLSALRVDIATLHMDPRNARSHNGKNLQAICDSLTAHGQRKAIVVQRKSDDGTPMVVRAGNGTLTAALQLGWKSIAAVVVDESDKDAIAYAIRDNRSAELAEWDYRILADELASYAPTDHAELGFDQDDLLDVVAAANESLLPDDDAEDDKPQVIRPDKRVSLMFTSEQFDQLKDEMNGKPTAEEVLRLVRLGKRAGVTPSTEAKSTLAGIASKVTS